jgi:oxygen-independent coproporphyrinogen-3 oxidase
MKDKLDEYIHYLLKELALYKDKIIDFNIKTIFIGGGTPSYIPEEHIYKILNYIYKNFNTSKLEEITIEANPGTLNKEKVSVYSSLGINRVSMGVQALDNSLLKAIGRCHKVEDFYNSYYLLREKDIKNINVDLMFGLPNQNLKDVINSLKEVINLGVEHISYYSLILEEGTLISKWYEEGSITLPSEDEERKMYHEAIEFLKSNGYNHYEISNFAKDGYECLHNLFYWKVKPYLGVGLSSHSNLAGKRFWNFSNFNIYYKKLKEGEFPVEGEEQIFKEIEMEEYCILGLRLIEGINKKEFKNRFNIDIENRYKDVINKHIKNGLIYENKGFIKLTNKGLDLSNLVEVDFLL